MIMRAWTSKSINGRMVSRKILRICDVKIKVRGLYYYEVLPRTLGKD